MYVLLLSSRLDRLNAFTYAYYMDKRRKLKKVDYIIIGGAILNAILFALLFLYIISGAK